MNLETSEEQESRVGRKPSDMIERRFEVLKSQKIFDKDGRLLPRNHPIWEDIAKDPAFGVKWKGSSIQRYVHLDRDESLTKLKKMEADVVDFNEEVKLIKRGSCKDQIGDDLERMHHLKLDPNYAPSIQDITIFKFHVYHYSPVELRMQKDASSLDAPIFFASGNYNFEKIDIKKYSHSIDNVEEVTMFAMLNQRLQPLATLLQQDLNESNFHKFLMEWLKRVNKFTVPTAVTLFSIKFFDPVCKVFFKISREKYVDYWMQAVSSEARMKFEINVQIREIVEILSSSEKHNNKENQKFYEKNLVVLFDSNFFGRFYELLRAIFILLGSEKRTAYTDESENLLDNAARGHFQLSAENEVSNCLNSTFNMKPEDVVEYILKEAKTFWVDSAPLEDELNYRYCINLIDDFKRVCYDFPIYMNFQGKKIDLAACENSAAEFYRGFLDFSDHHHLEASIASINVYEFLKTFTDYKREILKRQCSVLLKQPIVISGESSSVLAVHDDQITALSKEKHIAVPTISEMEDSRTYNFDKKKMSYQSISPKSHGLAEVQNDPRRGDKTLPKKKKGTTLPNISSTIERRQMIPENRSATKQSDYNCLSEIENWGNLGESEEPVIQHSDDSDGAIDALCMDPKTNSLDDNSNLQANDGNSSDSNSEPDIHKSFDSDGEDVYDIKNQLPWRCLLVNGGKLGPESFLLSAIRIWLVNTCPLDGLCESLIAACDMKASFSNFIRKMAVRHKNSKFFQIISEYVNKKTRKVYYQKRYECAVQLKYPTSRERDYLKIDCRDNVTSLFEKVMENYACVESEFKCPQDSCDYTIKKNYVFQTLHEIFVVNNMGSLEGLQEHLDAYYKKKITCYKCKAGQAPRTFKHKSYLCLDTEWIYLKNSELYAKLSSTPSTLWLNGKSYSLIGIVAVTPPVTTNDLMHYYSYIKLPNGRWEERDGFAEHVVHFPPSSQKKLKPALILYVRDQAVIPGESLFYM